jgi:hypothetical protein
VTGPRHGGAELCIDIAPLARAEKKNTEYKSEDRAALVLGILLLHAWAASAAHDVDASGRAR